MKNNKKQTNLNLKQKIILTNLLILAPIIIFIFIITYNALSKNLINNSIEYLLDKSRTTESYILNLLSSNDFEDKDEKKYGLNGSPTQVERIFPPSNNDDHEIWTGDSSELSERMEDKLRELKFI